LSDPIPVLPPVPELLNPGDIYILFYRHGTNPNCLKYFKHKGTLASANQRAIEHCQLMGFHFQYVRPFITDLKFDEERKLRVFGQS
jgi:hypothetical protein